MVMQVYMSANAWNEVKYPRVASVCMKNNKGHFEKHDQKAGKKKIASGALKPHELVSEAMRHIG